MRQNSKVNQIDSFLCLRCESSCRILRFINQIKSKQVLNAFPNATIFRPSVMVGDNDDFAYHWQIQKRYFHNFNIVPDHCQAKRQPIFVEDVAQAMLNALKMPETIG
ncbi:unnamed protein product [Paramecium octaurelia]|uniref:Uncharacterized protein n=1 Tax=Paramecium octaurelia TaxID=43137 RepID=A0A8S1UB17_PAROT|nr:unnamed protein product [Paramecium octaurelia]